MQQVGIEPGRARGITSKPSMYSPVLVPANIFQKQEQLQLAEASCCAILCHYVFCTTRPSSDSEPTPTSADQLSTPWFCGLDLQDVLQFVLHNATVAPRIRGAPGHHLQRSKRRVRSSSSGRKGSELELDLEMFGWFLWDVEWDFWVMFKDVWWFLEILGDFGDQLVHLRDFSLGSRDPDFGSCVGL